MTGRERLLKTIQGKVPDRVPISPWVDEFFARQFLGREEVDPVGDVIAVCETLGVDAILRPPIRWKYSYGGAGWDAKLDKTGEPTGERLETLTIHTRNGGSLRQIKRIEEVRPGYYFTATLEPIVKSPSDLALMEEYEIFPMEWDLSEVVRAQREVGQRGIVCPYAHGSAFNAVCRLRALESVLVDPHVDPVFYDELMRFAMRTDLRVAAAMSQLVPPPDTVFVGANRATADVVGSQHFDRFIFPYEQAHLDELRKLGLFAIYHNCGKSRALLPSYAALPCDGFESFPPPPLGDGDVSRTREILGNTVVLIGNIDQVHLLRHSRVGEVERAARQTMLAGKACGNFIFATSDELYDDAPLENVVAMISSAMDHSSY